MSKVPEKCSRCGAPISWEEGASIVKCEFCGYKNNFQNHFQNLEVRNDIKSKINEIYLKAKKLFRKKSSKYFILSTMLSVVSFTTFSIINNPVRPYKKQILSQCTTLAEYVSETDYGSEKIFKECQSNLSKDIKLVKILLSDKNSKIFNDKETMKKFPLQEGRVKIKYDYNFSSAVIWFDNKYLNKQFLENKKYFVEKENPVLNEIKNQISQLGSDQFDEYIKNGINSVDEKDYKLAIKNYDDALDIIPNSSIALTLRAESKIEINDYEGAILDLENALKNESEKDNKKRIYMDLGYARFELKKYSKALIDFNKVIEIDPKYEFVFNYRGLTKSALNDSKGAVNDFKKAINLYPETASGTYSLMASEKNKLKDYVGAIKDYDKSISLGRNNAYNFYFRGSIKQKLKNMIGACKDFRKAYSLDSKIISDPDSWCKY